VTQNEGYAGVSISLDKAYAQAYVEGMETRSTIQAAWDNQIRLAAVAGKLEAVAHMLEVVAHMRVEEEDEYPQSEQYAPGGGERDVTVAEIASAIAEED
jgi:hypothetical protein